MIVAKRPLTQKQIWAVRFFPDREGRLRDRALCDLAIVIQRKTGKPVQFEVTADVRASLLAWLEHRGGTTGDYAFPSRDVPFHRRSAFAGMTMMRAMARVWSRRMTRASSQPVA